MKQNNDNSPRVVSLFSGCGGLDLGFIKAGFDVVYANDIDKSLKETYETNIGSIEICDITNVEKSTLPRADIVLAGIPCQPFSSAGNRGSTADKRGQLFNEVLATLAELNPRVVIFENVRGFLSAKDEQGVKMPERLSAELNNYGYKTFYKLLNASDYGVPQNRHRVFIVGVRNDIQVEFVFPAPLNISKSDLTVGNVISKPLPINEEHECLPLSPQYSELIKYIPEGGSWKNVPYEKLPDRLKRIRDQIKKYRSPNFYRRFARDEIMGTVTAAATPENSGITHPLEHRRYSVREIARFQTFPDNFKFIGTSTRNKYKMIGNAVPVELAHVIATSLMEQVFNE